MDSIRSGPMDSSGILPEQELQGVFLSHAGKQKPFVRDMYNDLLKWPRHPKIKPFFDQDEKSLPTGAEFPARIFEAARRCTVAVVFLTKEFVTSNWPMLELITFVEARETTNPGLNLLPVFYDGEPTSGFDDSWIAAWEDLEAKSAARHSPGRTRISVELCKHALRQLRKVNGLVLNNSMGLQSLRESILQNVLKLLPPSSELDTTNVQGCLRLCKSTENMFEKDGRGVFCLGPYGVGGLGKTTLCRELCNYFGPSLFNRCCHLEIDSKDTDEDSSRIKRYIKILEAYSYLSKEQISNLNPWQAKKCVQQCLSEKEEKFLAVDNVQVGLDFANEAQNYLDWLSPGSIIIITSRSQDVLLGVKPGMLCRPIPNLEREEAVTLFLRNAAPHEDRQQLTQHQIRVLDKCLEMCFFSHRDSHGNSGQGGHYHPLALLAVASYLRERFTGRDSSILCWEKVLKDKGIMFSHSPNARDRIYKVLGLGFTNLCDVSKQLFIDVALFVSSAVAEKDIFNWLVFINHECAPELIADKLRELRRKSFLSFDSGAPSQDDEIFKNIRIHDLYREFAKSYIATKDEGQFTYGVYDDGILPLPSLRDSKWASTPRIHLERLTDVAKVKDWSEVAVVHLFGCQTITTVSIGELSTLRDLTIVDCPKLEVLNWNNNIGHDATEQRDLWGSTSQLCFVNLFSNRSLRRLPDFSRCSELQEIAVEGCSHAAESIRLHACSNLRVLQVSGNHEVQSILSCPKLKSVRLAWRPTHKGLPLLEDLHGLLELEIIGPLHERFGVGCPQILHWPEQCPRGSSIQCWEKVLKDKNIMFSHSRNAKGRIYKVLGLGFTNLCDFSMPNLCDLSMRLFIDVDLLATSAVAEKDIFNRLDFINRECAPELIADKPRELRRNSNLAHIVALMQRVCEKIYRHKRRGPVHVQ